VKLAIKKFKNFALSIITGLLAVLAFPQIDLFFLMWIAFVPLLFAIKDCSPKRAFVNGLISGFIFYGFLMYWIVLTLKFNTGSIIVSLIGATILWLYLALYWALWAFGVNKFSKNVSKVSRVLFASCLWVILEYVRTYLFTGFPWALVGYSQYSFMQIIQISQWTGVYGVSFLVIACNMLFFFWLSGGGKKFLVFGLCLILAISIFGSFQIKKFQNFGDESFKAVIIQPSIDQYKKWDGNYRNEIADELYNFALQVKGEKPDLVLWPETAIPYLLKENSKTYPLANALSESAGGLNIFGALFVEDDKLFNVLLSFEGGDLRYKQIHQKTHLVPFGEFIPFRKILEKFVGVLAQMGDIQKGSDANIFNSGGIFAGTLICSENFFPDQSIALVKNGAKVLTNQVNDAWFFDTAAPYQHFIMNVFRAIETRKQILVSANSGVSGIIAPSGKIIVMTKTFEKTTIPTNFKQNNYKPFYTTHQNIFILICLIILVLFISHYVRTRHAQ
jgi:apolipoprotein N-acyltransferase